MIVPISACSCQNGGVCTGKKCKCPAGYIGSSCEKSRFAIRIYPTILIQY